MNITDFNIWLDWGLIIIIVINYYYYHHCIVVVGQIE